MNSSRVLSRDAVIDGFDANAASYDDYTPVQREVARLLFDWALARIELLRPQRILEIGCGTGHLTQMLAEQWQAAKITAVEPAGNMRVIARKKMNLACVRNVEIRNGTAGNTGMESGSLDLIFSSMALHWDLDIESSIRHGRSLLRPGGRYYAAFMIDGSFREWNELCAPQGISSGTWRFPAASSFAALVHHVRQEHIVHKYASAHDFLDAINKIGGKSPRPDYEPVSGGALRRVLRASPKPFPVTYKIFFAEIAAPAPRG